MATTSSEITDIIKAKIKGFEGGAESVDVGTVVEIGDGIARVYGLANCMASELLDFGNDVFGLAFNLEEDTVSAIILGDYTGITEGGEVRTTGRIAETPVGEHIDRHKLAQHRASSNALSRPALACGAFREPAERVSTMRLHPCT